MQEDTLIGDLSVRSNLYYSALLRLPRSMPLKEKKKKVSIQPPPHQLFDIDVWWLTVIHVMTFDLSRWSK